VPYKWNNETIAVSEISTILFQQYQNPTVSVAIADGNKRFNYKKDLIPIQCSRCGNSYQVSPNLLLSMKDDRGYACSQCGNLSDEQLQEKIKLDRYNSGRHALIEMGIDPDEEDEEERENNEQEMAKAMLEANQEFVSPADIINTAEVMPPALPPPSPPKPVNITEPENQGNIPEKIHSEESTPPAPLQDEAAFQPLDETLDNGEDEFSQYFENGDEFEVATDVEEDIVELEDIINDDVEEDFIEEYEIEPSDGNDKIELEDIIGGSEDDDYIVDDSELPEIDDIEADLSEDDEEYVYLNNKQYTMESLTNLYKTIQDSLKKQLGLIPYGDIKYNNGVLEVTCKLCDKVFETNNIESLTDDVFTFNKENCVKYGLKFKGPLSISSCPHCRHSILTNGFNEFYRKKVESTIAKNKLNIVKPENYWYASPLTSYIVEANGATQHLNYVDLCNKYAGLDMSKHELFAPRGDDTKSKATSVDNGKGTQGSGFFELPEHDTKHQFHFDATETSQEPLFERQQEQAKSQMVFHPSDKYKAINANIAVLNGMENPFEREEKLDAIFKKTAFYEFIKELSEECQVKFRYQINQKTFEIPIVDFEPYSVNKPGFRLICADYDRNSMFNVPFSKIAESIPFQFNGVKTVKGESKFIYSVLYSDSLELRQEAAFNALVKYINPTVLAYEGKRIQLEGNLNIQYTDYFDYLNEFYEKYSPYPDGKPKNGEIGVLASWSSSKTLDARDMLETLASLETNFGQKSTLDKLEKDFGTYMVASIRYIEKLNKDTGKILYTITEYVEIGGALIADGFFQCIKALLKEYYLKYPEMRDRSPYIVLELDPNAYTSPSLKSYINRNTILPMDKIFKSQLMTKRDREKMNFNFNHVEQYLRYAYVQRKEFRPRGIECIRKDIRKFSAKSLSKIMEDEIRTAGLQTDIFDDTQRFIFIQNMGYVYATQLEIKEYFVHQGIVQHILLDGQTLLMGKAINPDDMFSNGGIVDSANNSISTINNPMYNPLFRAKIDRIRFGDVTPEAAEFYRSYMARKQQEMQNNNMFNGQTPNPGGIWQTPQVDPTMTLGAYHMPNMPGMNNNLEP
jgi:hypothetical protein